MTSKSIIIIAVVLAAAGCPGAWYWPFGGDDDQPKNNIREVPQTGKYITNPAIGSDKVYPKQPEKSDISVDKVRKLAAGGNPNAQLTLGKIYFDGLAGEKRDYKKAFKYFRQAAANGNPEAMYNLGVCYEGGLGCQKADRDRAISCYNSAAEAGVPEAQRKAAAVADEAGRAEQAFHFYQMLADDSDDADSMHHVAICLLNGYGTTVDPQLAVDYLRRAAEDGHVRSQVKLADCYQQGIGVECDYRETANWLLVAAHAGDPEAQAKLGMCYQTGRGVGQNDELAFEWYRAGAEAGFEDALYLVGGCYMEGRGTARDEAKAVECYRQAADKGDAMSQLALGDAYRNGRGVVMDPDQAMEWYRKAAEGGLGLAQAKLGALVGVGTAKHPADPEAAARWLKQAHDGGQPLAVIQVALCYFHGEGVPQDREKARRILADAAARGNRQAKSIYDLYFLRGSQDPEKAP